MLYNATPDQLYAPRAAVVDPVGFGRVAIVTGCASGIGLACTQLLLAHQFVVCGLDRSPFDYHRLLRPADHGRFHFHQTDLTQPGACEAAVRVCRWGSGGSARDSGQQQQQAVDVLVNVAGVRDNFASADSVTDALWDEVLAVNLTVPVRMMRAVLGPMRAQAAAAAAAGIGSTGGVIVNVASTAGTSGAIAGVAYTASKHGLIGATKNVAWRFRNEGIRCNAVLPGAVDSSIGQAISGHTGDGLDEAAYAELAPVHALQARPVTTASSPDGTAATTDITALEVAKAILFLLSDQARSINGICLPVDKAWGVV